jgi:predicted AAA+ superfamily ATPase
MLYNRLIVSSIEDKMVHFPVSIILGPRQVGKSTMVKSLFHFPRPHIYLDLELISDETRLEDPEGYLENHINSILVIDEVQRKPELFPLLRALVDKYPVGRYILLGSASEDIIMKSTESLAGRSVYYEIQPLTLWEVGDNQLAKLWHRGGFPKSFTSVSDEESMLWINQFIKSYIERELSISYLHASPVQLEKFLIMLTTVHGQLLNYSMIGMSMDITVPTVKKYVEFFEQKYLVRVLHPYFINVGKRLTKSPKLYIRDSGLLHYMRAIYNKEELESNIIKGPSWEGFVIQQILAVIGFDVKPYFYRTSDGTEIDLLLVKGTQIVLAFEIKYSNSPKLSSSIRNTINDLMIRQLLIVTPTSDEYKLNEKITVCPLKNVFKHLIEHKLSQYSAINQ